MHGRSSPSWSLVWLYGIFATLALSATTAYTLLGEEYNTFRPWWFLALVAASTVFMAAVMESARRVWRRRVMAARAVAARRKEALEAERRRSRLWHDAELAAAIEQSRMNDVTYQLPPPIVYTRQDSDSLRAALQRDFTRDTNELRRVRPS